MEALGVERVIHGGETVRRADDPTIAGRHKAGHSEESQPVPGPQNQDNADADRRPRILTPGAFVHSATASDSGTGMARANQTQASAQVTKTTRRKARITLIAHWRCVWKIWSRARHQTRQIASLPVLS